MTSKFGYNTLRVSDSLWPHLTKLDPTTCLFMDDAGAATRFASEHPNSISIFRAFSPNESDMYKQKGAMLQYTKSVANSVSSSVWVNVNCESELGGRGDYVGDLKQLISECVACLDWAYANGKKLALPHGAWYGLNPEHYQFLVPLINKINERPAQAVLTSDEYFGGHAFSGVHDSRGGEQWHVDPAHWVESNWPTLPKHYHMGRITDLFEWCVANNIKPPRWIGTETGADHLGDIESWFNTLVKTPGYSSIRGWKSLTSQWSQWYGGLGWSPERAYTEMLKAVWNQVYAKWPNVIGLCLYCWGSNNDPQWDQFRLDGAGEFQSLLEKTIWQGTPIVTPAAVPKPADAGTPTNIGLIVTPTYVNLRNAPTTTATVIQQVANGTAAQRYAGGEKKAVKEANGTTNDWSWVDILASAGGAVVKSGWMAKVASSWDAQIVAPKPIPVPVTYNSPTVALAVPYTSQYSESHGPNGCGSASTAMILNFLGLVNHKPTSLTSSDVSTAMNRPYGTNTSLTQLVNVAKSPYGFKFTGQSGLTPSAIRSELDAGRPVIILYQRGTIPGEMDIYSFAGSHWGVLSGYGTTTDNRNYYLLLEPLMKDDTPKPMKVLEADLITALKDEGSGNSPNIGIFVDPSAIVVPEPDPEPEPEPTPDDDPPRMWTGAEIDLRISEYVNDVLKKTMIPGTT